MKKTFFSHVPKTGGTTLDRILGDHFGHRPSLRHVQGSAPIEAWHRIGDPELDYLSGHLSAAAVDAQRFDNRITIIRAPAGVIGSRASFNDHLNVKDHFLSDLAAKQVPYEVYREYFSPGFDLQRFIVERQYGVADTHYLYADPCTVEQAMSSLAQFDTVLDFNALDSEIKRFVIRHGLFPPLGIERRRSYRYEADDQLVRRLISPFDTAFYERARERFEPVPSDIDRQYSDYMARYCVHSGWRLGMHETADISLLGPIGRGWFDPEPAATGRAFRWSSDREPTLEIPIAEACRVTLHVYANAHDKIGLTATARTLIGRQTLPMSTRFEAGITVMQCSVDLKESDWLVVEFGHDDMLLQADAETSIDNSRRHVGFVLGRALLRRVEP